MDEKTHRELRARFDDLVLRQHSYIDLLCMRLCSNDFESSMDLKQECCIVMWRHIHTLRPDLPPKQEAHWVYWMCIKAFSRWGGVCRIRHHMALDEKIADPYSEIDEKELREYLESLASFLTDHERRAYAMMLDDWPVSEMAQTLSINEASARQLRYRILVKLRSIVKPKGP